MTRCQVQYLHPHRRVWLDCAKKASSELIVEGVKRHLCAEHREEVKRAVAAGLAAGLLWSEDPSPVRPPRGPAPGQRLLIDVPATGRRGRRSRRRPLPGPPAPGKCPPGRIGLALPRRPMPPSSGDTRPSSGRVKGKRLRRRLRRPLTHPPGRVRRHRSGRLRRPYGLARTTTATTVSGGSGPRWVSVSRAHLGKCRLTLGRAHP
jgi:hypothetical protein